MRRLASPRMMALRPCTGVRIRCREGHVPLTTLSRRVIAAHSRLPQAHWHRNQAADLAAASCEMASCHIASSHSMHEVPSPHASAPTGTTHEHSPGHAMPGRTVHDMQGGCGSREPAAARRAPAPDEFGCRCATHISDGQRGLPPGDPEGSRLLASPPAAAESDGRQRVPRRRAPHGSRGFIVRRGPPKKYVVKFWALGFSGRCVPRASARAPLAIIAG